MTADDFLAILSGRASNWQAGPGWLCFPRGGQVDFCALSIYCGYIKERVSRREINFCNLNSKLHE